MSMMRASQEKNKSLHPYLDRLHPRYYPNTPNDYRSTDQYMQADKKTAGQTLSNLLSPCFAVDKETLKIKGEGQGHLWDLKHARLKPTPPALHALVNLGSARDLRISIQW